MLEQRILEQLFRQNYSEMIHLASVLLGDNEDAEDVVQDIFLRVADSDIGPKNDRRVHPDYRHQPPQRQRARDAATAL